MAMKDPLERMRSQMTSKFGKNNSDTQHFDVICDLLLNRCMVTLNLFVSLSNSWLKGFSPRENILGLGGGGRGNWIV